MSMVVIVLFFIPRLVLCLDEWVAAHIGGSRRFSWVLHGESWVSHRYIYSWLPCVHFLQHNSGNWFHSLEAVVPADHYIDAETNYPISWRKIFTCIGGSNIMRIGFPCLRIQIVAGLSHGTAWRLSVQCCEELLRDYHDVCRKQTLRLQHVKQPRKVSLLQWLQHWSLPLAEKVGLTLYRRYMGFKQLWANGALPSMRMHWLPWQ